MLTIVQGDITTFAVDAIVNAANNSLLGGGGVDGAIHRAAGPELLKKTRTLGGCPTGEVRLTEGYRLPAKYIIHTVGPIYSGRQEDPKLLENCYKNAMALAFEKGFKTLAFPSISTGVYHYPLQEAAEIAVRTICTAPGFSEMEVQMVCFDPITFATYQKALAQFQEG